MKLAAVGTVRSTVGRTCNVKSSARSDQRIVTSQRTEERLGYSRMEADLIKSWLHFYNHNRKTEVLDKLLKLVNLYVLKKSTNNSQWQVLTQNVTMELTQLPTGNRSIVYVECW